MRLTRRKHCELSPDERKKLNCRSYTKTLQERGVIPKGPCAECGSDVNVENHHEDYDDPRTFTRLCRKCHKNLHREAPPETLPLAA
jgi:hypothetical protein